MEGETERKGAPRCVPCNQAAKPINAIQVAIVVLIAIVIIWYLAKALQRWRSREHFDPKRAQEVYEQSKDLFGKSGGKATYSDYKAAVSGPADPVQYTDIRQLWKENKLSPNTVGAAL